MGFLFFVSFSPYEPFFSVTTVVTTCHRHSRLQLESQEQGEWVFMFIFHTNLPPCRKKVQESLASFSTTVNTTSQPMAFEDAATTSMPSSATSTQVHPLGIMYIHILSVLTKLEQFYFCRWVF